MKILYYYYSHILRPFIKTRTGQQFIIIIYVVLACYQIKVLKVYMKFEKINHTVKNKSVIEKPLKTNKIILKSIIYYIHIVVQCSLVQTAADE